MKAFLRWLALAFAVAAAVALPLVEAQGQQMGGAPAPATLTAAPKVLVVYDAPPNTEYEKLGYGYAIMLRNLLGHFNATVDFKPVHQYTAGTLANYDTTFYLGAYYENPLPAAFLADAAATTKNFVWFKYNVWQLAWNTSYNFGSNRGMNFVGLRGMNATPSSTNPAPGFFDTVHYKGRNFVKYYAYDSQRNVINADPDIGLMNVSDSAKAQVVVNVANARSGEVAPYAIRSGRFWYMADVPFSFIGPRDRYLVFSDLLHDMLGINHPTSHLALVRLEDVGATTSVRQMKQLADYLRSQSAPFSVATIPYYVDPLGVYNDNVPMAVPLSQASGLKTILNYSLRRGGEVVMHGYTHQYGTLRNPSTAVSGDDYEFWNITTNSPVAEDSPAWVLDRLRSGLADLRNNGYEPVAWETPHYHASATSSRVVPQLFNTTYQRVVYYTADKPDFHAATGKDFAMGQIFPYVVYKDFYGNKVLPESLGNIEYDLSWIDPTANYNYTSQDILTNANYMLAVRDGFASFFFHPFLLDPELGVPGFEDFRKCIEGIKALGYTFVPPSKVN